MIPDIPDKIYKYHTFDLNGYFKGLIENTKLYFSSAEKFNDPFDCNVVPDYESGSDKDIFEKFLSFAKDEHPKLSIKEQIKIAKKEADKNRPILQDPKLFNKRKDDIINNLFGICSLTEKNDSLLMWSHYADSHRGFCVELDGKELRKIGLNYRLINEVIIIEKVTYSQTYPVVNPYKIRNHGELLGWIITKSSDWEYEQEWRMIYAEHPNEVVEFPDKIMKAIYLGVNCSKENEDIVKDLIQNKKYKPRLFRAKLRRFEFGIDFEEIG